MYDKQVHSQYLCDDVLFGVGLRPVRHLRGCVASGVRDLHFRHETKPKRRVHFNQT